MNDSKVTVIASLEFEPFRRIPTVKRARPGGIEERGFTPLPKFDPTQYGPLSASGQIGQPGAVPGC